MPGKERMKQCTVKIRKWEKKNYLASTDVAIATAYWVSKDLWKNKRLDLLHKVKMAERYLQDVTMNIR